MRCVLFSVIGGSPLLVATAIGCNTAGPPTPVPQHQVPQQYMPQQQSAGQAAPDVGGQAYELPPASPADHQP